MRSGAIAEAEDRSYRILFQQAAVGMHRTDMVGRYTEANERFCIIVGCPHDQLLGKSYLEFVHPDDLSALQDRVKEISSGESSDYVINMRIIRASDHAVRWVRVTGSLTDTNSDDYFFCVVEDITDERLLVERQQLLLDELNHRVKNTLSTVQSLAMNTMRSSENSTEFYGDFESRLMALSKAHNLLTLGTWTGVPLHMLVGLTLETFAVNRSSFEGPHVVLKPNATVTLSMVLHELATNAAKYGSLSVPNGRVDVKWEIVYPQDGSGNRHLNITWTESGGPVVKPPRRTGFGSRLIEGAAARELAAYSKILYERDGVKCHFNFSLSEKVMVYC